MYKIVTWMEDSTGWSFLFYNEVSDKMYWVDADIVDANLIVKWNYIVYGKHESPIKQREAMSYQYPSDLDVVSGIVHDFLINNKMLVQVGNGYERRINPDTILIR